MAEAALTCVEKLAEARAALHSLLTGTIQVSVTYEGRGVSFRNSSSDDINKLRVYILELEALCGGPNGGPCYGPRRGFNVTF